MIQSIAFRFISSAWGQIFLLALAALAMLLAWGRRRERQGAAQAQENFFDQIRTMSERGRNAYTESQREAAGRSVDALIDGMRSRDGDWRRLRNLR